MSDAVISLMFAVGVSGWFYSKVIRRTGGANGNTVLVLVGLVAIMAFVMFMIILEMIAD